MLLVVVILEGAIDKHLQALDIAALSMLLNTAGVAHVEEVTLLTSSVGWSRFPRLRIDGASGVARDVTVTVSVKVTYTGLTLERTVCVVTVDFRLVIEILWNVSKSQHTQYRYRPC
jgi:hypothetical protein